MKVTLISPYALSVFGGVQEQVLSMSRELESRGHRVLIVTPDSGDTTTYDTPAEIVRLGSLVTLPANGSRAPLTLAGSASRAALAAIRSFGPAGQRVARAIDPGRKRLAGRARGDSFFWS